MNILKIPTFTVIIVCMFCLAIIGCAGSSPQGSGKAMTDSESVAADTAGLAVYPGGSDTDINSITTNLPLTANGANGSTITWSSSNILVIANDGTVVRPAFGTANAVITLTATIIKNGITETKTFTVTVLKNPPTDTEAVAADKGSLVDTAILGSTNTDLLHITGNLNLNSTGSSGTIITWVSNKPAVLSNDGTVTCPAFGAGDSAVTLTATIKRGSETATVTFTLSVLETPQTASEAISADKASLVDNSIRKLNPDLSHLTSDLNLPVSGASGTTINWSSDNTSFITNAGVVTCPSSGTVTVTMRATIAKTGAASETKDFICTVIHVAAWSAVGDPAGLSEATANDPKIAIFDNTPYVAYIDTNNYTNKVTVKKFDGTSWVLVGSGGISAGGAYYIDIVIAQSGTPYVSYRDSANGERITVMKFNGTSWELVGSAGFGSVDAIPKIAIDSSDIPYVSDCAWSYGNREISVYKLNGASWETVGTTGATGIPCIAVNSANVPYLAYSDKNTNKTTVLRYNGTGWETVGSAGFSANTVDMLSIKIGPSDTPYIAFMDLNTRKATMMKFSGSSWETVGSGLDGQVSSAGMGFAFYSGVPYVVYGNESNMKATVMKYSGGTWITVGNIGFTPGEFYNINIAINSTGIPYVVFKNEVPMDFEHMGDPEWIPEPSKAMVMKLL